MKLRTLLFSLLAIGLFAWFLRHANLADVVTQAQRARIDLVLLALVSVGVTYWLRALRWQYLLAPIGPTRFRSAFRTTVVGFAASFLLPARAGEVIRPYLLARQEGLSAMSTFATIVIERVLDLIAVLALLAMFIWGVSESGGVSAALLGSIRVSALLAGVAAFVLMGLMLLLASHPERIGQLALRAGRILPSRLAHTVGALARTFSEGLAVMRTPKPLFLALLWSFPMWIVMAAESWWVTRAFGIEMSFQGSFLLQAILVVGVAVPTPGAIGGFHEAYRLGVTTFFGASNDEAVGAAIVLHAVSFIPVTLLGVFFMAQDGLSVRRLQGLAGAVRQDKVVNHNEVPILRPSGR
jgi:hypothetical protein